MYRWILDPADRYAVLANGAIKNLNRDYHVVVEIACVLKPEELLVVRRAYHNRYKHSLEEHVAAHTSGYLRQVNKVTLIIILQLSLRKFKLCHLKLQDRTLTTYYCSI
jgi:hypothetical protein